MTSFFCCNILGLPCYLFLTQCFTTNSSQFNVDRSKASQVWTCNSMIHCPLTQHPIKSSFPILLEFMVRGSVNIQLLPESPDLSMSNVNKIQHLKTGNHHQSGKYIELCAKLT